MTEGFAPNNRIDLCNRIRELIHNDQGTLFPDAYILMPWQHSQLDHHPDL
jgi:hypothetical protein